jgi:hypothetical protein
VKKPAVTITKFCFTFKIMIIWVGMDFDRVGSIFWISHFVVYLTALSEAIYSVDFDVCTVHLVQFIIQTNKYTEFLCTVSSIDFGTI